MVGRVFREFAVSISVAIIVSGFVSLTLTPMLCARVLKSHQPGEEEKQNFVLRAFEHLFERMLAAYQWSLDRVLAYQVDHADGHARHHRRHDLALHHRAQGLLPDRGHRLRHRHHRGQHRYRI